MTYTPPIPHLYPGYGCSEASSVFPPGVTRRVPRGVHVGATGRLGEMTALASGGVGVEVEPPDRSRRAFRPLFEPGKPTGRNLRSVAEVATRLAC